MKRLFLVILFFLVFFPLYGKIKVVCGIDPAKYLVDRIGGEKVDSISLIPPGVEAHSFSVSPRQMMKLTQAQLYFAYGFPFEKNLVEKLKNLNKNLKFVFLYQGLKRRMENTPHPDPHIWLSPPRYLWQARLVYKSLTEVSPENSTYFLGNYLALAQEILEVDGKITNILLPFKGKTFFVYHPAWGYFAEDYGLSILTMQQEGKEPTPLDLVKIFQRVKQEKVKVLFVQSVFHSPKVDNFIRQTNLKVVPIEDIFYNWPQKIWEIAQKIKENL